jgi:phosphotransferase system  glucose/maltose/N-acetylglucosamine-specific IIC component
MFEHHTKPLLPRRIFYRRVVRNFGFGLLFIMFSLGIGMAGYHGFEKMPWLDSFLNAAMILSGMGPVGTLQTDAGKIFAGCYALYSGLALIAIVGIVFAPIIHRFLHKFHLEDEGR